jgi:hypothetical protein
MLPVEKFNGRVKGRETYGADVNNWGQLQNVFDRRLGFIQWWGFEQCHSFRHFDFPGSNVCCNLAINDKDLEKEKSNHYLKADDDGFLDLHAVHGTPELVNAEASPPSGCCRLQMTIGITNQSVEGIDSALRIFVFVVNQFICRRHEFH